MIEKVNPSHPDKVADRIAGALVDLAYKKNERPKIAVEVLIGHGVCHIIIETSEEFYPDEVADIVKRIGGANMLVDLALIPQDKHLAENQSDRIRCGDNGIFKGVPLREKDKAISDMAHYLYEKYPYDGKFILTDDKVIICQSNVETEELEKDPYIKYLEKKTIINPLGDWTGGTDVDSGATNRKLGSDMAQSVTGGGLHGKDLSKADVSVNIYAFLKAQATNEEVELSCAIGDEMVDGVPYEEIVKMAGEYINGIGGFEKFAEWGLY
jgi:S-adenosylmethionine synthetase